MSWRRIIRAPWPFVSRREHERELADFAAHYRREAMAAEARHRARLGAMRRSEDWA